MKKIYTFLRYNKHKRMSLYSLVISGYYRILILILPRQYIEKLLGTRNVESDDKVSVELYSELRTISYIVNRICNKTPWESKCLVRALVAQRLLKRRKIKSTLYLGVGMCDEKMVAHAWIRCGQYYLTGGNGEGYAVVAKFLA